MILSGRQLARNIQASIADEIKVKNIQAKLAIVQIGSNEASTIYIRRKKKSCKKVGIECVVHRLPEESSQKKVLGYIDQLNQDNTNTGILIQSPIPSHLDFQECVNCIHPNKDVDGLHAHNLGKLFQGNPKAIAGATPMGIMQLLAHHKIDVVGKHVVIIGRSLIVGKPLSILMNHAGATVTLCHSGTLSLENHTKQADIIISATGQKKLVTKGMVSDRAVIIDVGITREENGNISGDADYENLVEEHNITPVPGGVGPMTVASLLQNIVLAYKLQSEDEK